MIVAFEEELFDDFKKDNDILQKEDLPEFFAWYFWPMSTKVLEDLEFFKKIGFIKAKYINSIESQWSEEMATISSDLQLDDSNDAEYLEEEYSLTQIWLNYVTSKLNLLLTDNQKNILRKLKIQFNSATLDTILSYIYNNPKYSKYIWEKSKIRDKYITV